MNSKAVKYLSLDEAAMQRLAAALAGVIRFPACIYLQGDLGTGKTFLVRALLRALGFQGRVKSPTYAIAETYELDFGSLLHLDLYRLSHPQELEFLGIAELMAESLCLVEWPQQGRGYLPEADVIVSIKAQQELRNVAIRARSPRGMEMLASLDQGEQSSEL